MCLFVGFIYQSYPLHPSLHEDEISIEDRFRVAQEYSNDFFISNHDHYRCFMIFVASRFVREGDTVIDVGALNGYITLPLADIVGKKGHVYSFEPIPYLAKRLKIKFKNNPSVRVIDKAVTSERIINNKEYTTFYYVLPPYEALSGIRRRCDISDKKDIQRITVPVTTLDRTINKENRVSFIKIDVEGGEFDVLLGARKILLSHRPLIIFEYNNWSAIYVWGYTREEFLQFFKDINYNLYKFTGGRFEEVIWNNSMYWKIWAVPKVSLET